MSLPSFALIASGLRSPAGPSGSGHLVPAAPSVAGGAPAAGVPSAFVPFARRFRFLRRLGEGVQGRVFLAVDRFFPARRLAVKIPKPGTGFRESLVNEMMMLSLADGAVPRLRGVLIRRGNFCGLATEFHPGATLDACLGEDLSMSRRCVLASGVARSVLGLLSRRILHRDLKPAHLLLTAAGFKILDLGLARRLDGKIRSDGLGTALYASPEQLAGNGVLIDEKSDLFSLGLILYEVLTGAPFFGAGRGIEDLAGFLVFRRQRLRTPWTLPPDCPPFIVTLLHRLIVEDAGDRAGPAEVRLLVGGPRR